MRNTFFVTVAAAALLAGVGIASAQDKGGAMDKGGASAPSATQSKSMDKPADNAAAKKPETTGQGAAATKEQNETKKSDAKDEKSTTGQSGGAMKNGAAQNEKSEKSPSTSAQGEKSPSSGSAQNAGKTDTSKSAQSPNDTSKSAQSPNDTSKSAQSPNNTTNSAQGNNRSNSTNTANSSTNVNVNITTEQKTRIRETVLKSGGGPRLAKADFAVRVGTAIPTSVRLAPVPQTIVEINPAWRGFEYVIVGEEIIIVDPHSHEIVYILT